MDDDNNNKDNININPVAGGFSGDSTWTFPATDYTFFSTDAAREESSVLNDFGWNFNPVAPSIFDRIESDGLDLGVDGSEVQVDEAGDVSISHTSNPLVSVSTSSSEERVESSTVSADAVSGGKPPPSSSSDRVSTR